MLSFEQHQPTEAPTSTPDFMRYKVADTAHIAKSLDQLDEKETADSYGVNMALGLLMQETGWREAREANGTGGISLNSEVLHKAELVAFCGWLTEEYPNPGQVASYITTQEALRTEYPDRLLSNSAAQRLEGQLHNFYNWADRAAIWDTAMGLAYGDRWQGFKNEEQFNFRYNWLQPPIMQPSLREAEERQLLTKRLTPHEEVEVKAEQKSVMTEKEMAELGTEGELRVVIQMGKGDDGQTIGVIKAPDESLQLVGITKNSRGLYQEVSHPVTLQGKEGSVILGRGEAALQEVVPKGVPSTVSRKHIALQWEPDGTIRVKNLKPYNFTKVQEAHGSRVPASGHLATSALQAAVR